MKNLGKISVIVLFLLSIFVGSFTVYSISKVQSYGTLINYLGIVRGATQRLVKLELQQQPHDELISTISFMTLKTPTVNTVWKKFPMLIISSSFPPSIHYGIG
ncbi:hypothetical protein [Phascolarctobacterium faecium]|uniref:hypothetical protein n=1 Tax=Phascolarctobacterium faecium TaxID=33025 RepID=UPI00266D3FA4|nr:hypothetical protein [Phascolarctobacterium faecium]